MARPWVESGYARLGEIPDLWSAPVQGITISESSQLSSVSQLRRSHPVSPLHSQIALAQSWDYANVLRNPEIELTYCAVSRLAVQSRDWHTIWECTVQSQDPRLCRTYLLLLFWKTMGEVVASFPGLLYLQFLIACSIQNRGEKAWGIL